MTTCPTIEEERERRRRFRRFRYRDEKTAYLLLAPTLLLLTVFAFVPLLMALVRSFQNYQTHVWTLGNYDYIFKTPSFLKSFGNVTAFTAVVVVAMMLTSFLFAHVCMRAGASPVVKVVIYIPCIMSSVVTSIMFLFLLNYGGGLINSLLITGGRDPIAFRTDGLWPQALIIVPTLWLGFGYNTLVMLAGLLNIPMEYYEAAKIDGANGIVTMFRITVPNMRNYFILILVNLITGNLQMLDIPLFMTGGGPLESTLTPCLYLFNTFRDPSRPENVSIAGALIVMVIIVVINAVAFRLIHSQKSEDS